MYERDKQQARTQSKTNYLALALWALLVVGVLAGIIFAVPAFARFQAVLSAENQVHLNNIAIQQQAQLIQVEQQRKQIRIVEAEGIAESQRIINATLTDKYLQHEAIKAQELMAKSENHTVVYIPSGQNGVPLVATFDAEQGR